MRRIKFTGETVLELQEDTATEEVVPSVVELRGGGRVSEFSQTVEVAISGAGVAMVVWSGLGARRAARSRSTAMASLARSE